MKPKQIVLVVVLLAVLGGLAWLSLNKGDQKTSVQELDVDFAVRDTANINKIFIADKSGNKYLLTRTSKTTWLINNHIVASPPIVNALLEVIRDVDMKRPCTANERPEVIKQLSAEHLKVEIYVKDELVRSYYLGAVTIDHLGNYIMMTDAQDPYVGHIPGFEGYIDIRYKVDSVDWRSTKAYHGSPNSIRRLTLTTDNKTVLDLTQDGNEIKVAGLNSTDAAKAKSYLAQYNKLFIGQWTKKATLATADSLNRTIPAVVLDIQDANKALSQTIKLYTIPDMNYAWQAVVWPQGYVGTVSKDLLTPFLVSGARLGN